MSHEFAIADTCFLIDWSRYRRRDSIFRLFKVIFVPENVLNEIESERTISWISEGLRRDCLALYTPLDEAGEVRELVEKSRLYPQIPSIDVPEALCLVIGRRRGYTVLTENRGALLVPRFLEEYSKVVVWRALEVLLNLALRSILNVDCSNPEELFEEYSRDTLHMFPTRALEEAVEEVKEHCRKR